jgi:hypothetical protein
MASGVFDHNDKPKRREIAVEHAGVKAFVVSNVIVDEPVVRNAAIRRSKKMTQTRLSARTPEVVIIWASTAKWNVASQNLLAALGFEIVGGFILV